jgi:hypothetical protein
MQVDWNGRNSETFCRSHASFYGFHFSIARRSIRLQRIQQLARDAGHAINGAMESFFVCLGRFREAAQFSNELKGGRADLVVRRRRREVMQGFDVSTHKVSFGIGAIKMQRQCVSNAEVSSLARSGLPLLLCEPLINIRPVVDVENVMIAFRKHSQLWMAAGGFKSVD